MWEGIARNGSADIFCDEHPADIDYAFNNNMPFGVLLYTSPCVKHETSILQGGGVEKVPSMSLYAYCAVDQVLKGMFSKPFDLDGGKCNANNTFWISMVNIAADQLAKSMAKFSKFNLYTDPKTLSALQFEQFIESINSMGKRVHGLLGCAPRVVINQGRKSMLGIDFADKLIRRIDLKDQSKTNNLLVYGKAQCKTFDCTEIIKGFGKDLEPFRQNR